MRAILPLLVMFGYLCCMENNNQFEKEENIKQWKQDLKYLELTRHKLLEKLILLEKREAAIKANIQQWKAWNEPKTETMFSLDEDLLND